MGSDQPDRYAVLGHPVAHSKSPFIHAEFARQTGEPVVYGRVLCPLDGFEASVRAFAVSQEAGMGPARGCNVTMPFKLQAARLAARVSTRAALAQAANVLDFQSDGWLADNTDGVGLLRDIAQNAGFDLAGKRMLLIGAGGAAAGVLGPLIEAGPSEIVVANRSRDKATALVQRHRLLRPETTVRDADLADCGARFDLVVNASASSVHGGGAPVDAAVLSRGGLAIDLMYGPSALPFLAWAEAHGARGRDGLGMLVEQAAEAFYLWRGVRPDTVPVLRALREHLAQASG